MNHPKEKHRILKTNKSIFYICIMENNLLNSEDIEPGHYCPYCGQKSMLINDHFSHIEFEHPDKPLI